MARAGPVGWGLVHWRDPPTSLRKLEATIADPGDVPSVAALQSGQVSHGVDLTESTVSHHLGQLRKAGMVPSERRGMNVFHRARTEALDALREVLDPNCCR
ncbi:ArsR family transcriptional regulator [Rhodococcus sp. C26F]